MTIFDWLDHISNTKRSWDSFTESEQNTFNAFMINRFISMEPNYVILINYIKNLGLSNKNLYITYIQLLPKGKKFYKYIKPTKSKWNKEQIMFVANKLELSSSDIISYLEVTDGKLLLKSTLNELGYNEKNTKNTKINKGVKNSKTTLQKK